MLSHKIARNWLVLEKKYAFVLPSSFRSNWTPTQQFCGEGGIPEQLYGKLPEFQTDKERIMDYHERLQLFFEANRVQEGKRVPRVTDSYWGNLYMYALLRNLLAPQKPSEKSFKELSAILRDYFQPKPVVTAKRFHFHRRNKAFGESVAEYQAELRRLATHCEFKQYLSEALRDRLVCGLRSESTQKNLLAPCQPDAGKSRWGCPEYGGSWDECTTVERRVSRW